VTDFLDVKRREITDRLKELAPLVDEYRRLEAAASALDGVGASSISTAASAAAPRRRGPGRPRGSVSRAGKATVAGKTTTVAATTPAEAGRKKPGRPKGSGKKVGRPAGKVGRRKGSGTRAAEALTFVQGQPGITIPELAAKMGIKQNYLYRVLPGLEQDGKLEKKGRGWHPKAA
jgi:hypothetical protein